MLLHAQLALGLGLLGVGELFWRISSTLAFGLTSGLDFLALGLLGYLCEFLNLPIAFVLLLGRVTVRGVPV